MRPIVGRTFVESDQRLMSDAMVLHETLWRSRFGGDPALVGRATRIGDRAFTVIGIVPAGFQFDIPGTTSTGPSNFWTLLGTPAGRGPAERYAHYLQVIGRPTPGVSLDAARADIAGVADALARENAGHEQGHRASPIRSATG